MQQRALADGLYEMALSPAGDALYVASAEGFKDVQGGVVYKLDPKTLKNARLESYRYEKLWYGYLAGR